MSSHNLRRANAEDASGHANRSNDGNDRRMVHPDLLMPVLRLEALANNTAVDKFLTDFAAFKVLHSEAKMAKAVVPKVVVRLQRLHKHKFEAVCPDAAKFCDLSDDSVTELLRKSFAVPSLESAVKRLSQHKFHWNAGNSTMGKFTATASSFLDEMDRCEDSGVTLSVKVVKDALIRCVTPRPVRQKVERRFGEKESSIATAGDWIPFFLDLLESWVKSAETLRDIESPDHSENDKVRSDSSEAKAMTTQVSNKRNKKRSRDEERLQKHKKKQSTDSDGGKVCYGCGHPGHGRDSCSNRHLKGFVKAPGRISKPLPL